MGVFIEVSSSFGFGVALHTERFVISVMIGCFIVWIGDVSGMDDDDDDDDLAYVN